MENKAPITYFSKDRLTCPFCGFMMSYEIMHKGGGRMIAGDLTDELHRQFEPSKKYGPIYPLIYDIAACPKCHGALFLNDFVTLNDDVVAGKAMEDAENRFNKVDAIFPYYNLQEEKSLYDGCAAYYLALLTYEYLPSEYAPTFKSGLICLRLAWLTKDLNKVCPGHNFDHVSKIFYQKALFYYQQTMIYQQSGQESIDSIRNFGPDMDKNYGFDSIAYLSALLEYKYGQREDMAARLKKLEQVKLDVTRIFGLGKASKSKPGPLLEAARGTYEAISKELKENDIFNND